MRVAMVYPNGSNNSLVRTSPLAVELWRHGLVR
jgi:hypothetical protein